jgi:hypothetical protein
MSVKDPFACLVENDYFIVGCIYTNPPWRSIFHLSRVIPRKLVTDRKFLRLYAIAGKRSVCHQLFVTSLSPAFCHQLLSCLSPAFVCRGTDGKFTRIWPEKRGDGGQPDLRDFFALRAEDNYADRLPPIPHPPFPLFTPSPTQKAMC